jgi:dihydroxyacetone kinase-like protein
MPVIVFTDQEIKDFFAQMAETMQANKDRLIEMDSIFGDGDLGLTMSKGFQAANAALQGSEEADLGKLLYLAGKTMASSAPSTMGTLIANGWMQAGKTLKGRTELDGAGINHLFEAFYRGIAELGGAKPGEKTVLDGLTGSLAFLKETPLEAKSIAEITEKLRRIADEDVSTTTTMLARHGRAAIRGEASLGVIDPGAEVARLIIESFAVVMEGRYSK